MKRHDVSNPGPDTRYPAHEHAVILWTDSGKWIEGWFDEESGLWCEASTCGTQPNVIAWSDPTEPESAEPVAKIVSWSNGSHWRNYKVDWLSDDLPEGALLYATPPDTAAVMRQAVEALRLAVKQNSHDMMMTGDELRICESAIAALRGALPQPKESHEQNQI